MGPLGRLQSLINAKVIRYQPHYQGAQGVVPSKIRVEPRDAFRSLPSTSRSVVDASPQTPSWGSQRLLAELDAQLVSVCGGSLPRVFDGTNWRTYPNNAVLTQKLEQEVLHTSQRTIQAPDSAQLGGVTCAVWTESSAISTGALTTTYVGFKAANGTWVVQPTVLFASSVAFVITQARVVSDGANFFVFFNNATNVLVNAYASTGALLGQSGIALPSGQPTPGIWDVTAQISANGRTVLYAQLAANAGDHGVTFMAVGWNGSAVITTINTDTTIHASQGPMGFLTKQSAAAVPLAYLATTLAGTPEAIWAYEISSNLTQTHVYNTGVTVANNVIDTVTGYVDPVTFAVVVSYSTLANVAQATGPKFDPQRRYMASFQTDRSNVTTQLRVTQSLAQASRAFLIDGNYYSLGYYQSGSGNVLVQTKESVSITTGDYMIGAAIQPLTVAVGDQAAGSPLVTTANPAAVGGGAGATVLVTDSQGSTSIVSGDTVVQVSASGLAGDGIPDGTPLLRWTFSGRTAVNISGSRLTLTGASANNSTFDIVFGSSITVGAVFYTPVQDRFGNSFAGASFAAGGHFVITSMTSFGLADLSTIITSSAIAAFYPGGTIVITGSSGGNNGTYTIARAATSAGSFPTYPGMNPLYAQASTTKIWAVTTTQASEGGNYAATVTNPSNNQWFFANGEFDSTYVGTNLVVAVDLPVPNNVGSFPVTAAGIHSLTTGGQTSLYPQIFGFPLAQISIQLTTQIAYTFKLQSVTPDYTYQGAIVLVQGALDPSNNGTYRIVQINADGTFIALPTNGLSNQFNELFTGAQTITIFFAPNNEPAFQSTWFVVPMTGNQPVAGRFEYGLAYADWRIEGDPDFAGDLFQGALASVNVSSTGAQFVLPYRAENVTSAVTQITAAGQVDIGDAAFSSTVGLKQFWLGSASGQAYSNSGELLIPGPMAGVFTASGFFEDNVNVAPEAPFLVSQSVGGAGQLGLTLGSIRVYVVVFEQTDENGNRIYSPPSPPLVVNMAGTNNVATIGGRVAFPLGSTGQPIASTFGPTCRNVTISIYATAFINGVPTTQRYKITSDLAVNGLAPVSATNPSGFSFPDSFTWNYIDQNPDSEIQGNEVLYVDKGYLPRYPAPAFSAGVGSWHNREWVIGYDGAIWMSGEKTEGDAIWFNPAFRYVLPTDDEPIGIAAMEDYLIVTCAQSIWYIPTAQFPDATGANGGLPTPVRLPFQNGSIAGFAQTIREGVAYDSTAGGLWLITRNLDNVWLSHDVLDTLATPIVGLALDKAQRLFVLQQSGPIMVYDGIPAAWYAWQAPTVGVLLATYGSQACYQDGATVSVVTPGQAADLIAGVTYGIAPDITLAPLAPANVRGLKRIWEFQIVGTWLGPHRLNVILSYPEDGVPSTVYAPFTPLSSNPYVLPFNPISEEATLYGIRIFADFVGIGSPGLTFAFEMISAQVGLDSGVGLRKLPQGVTLVAAT